jgi:hypothetical protein
VFLFFGSFPACEEEDGSNSAVPVLQSIDSAVTLTYSGVDCAYEIKPAGARSTSVYVYGVPS